MARCNRFIFCKTCPPIGIGVKLRALPAFIFPEITTDIFYGLEFCRYIGKAVAFGELLCLNRVGQSASLLRVVVMKVDELYIGFGR